MNYLKIEKKYRNNCLKASQAEGREFESRLPLQRSPSGFQESIQRTLSSILKRPKISVLGRFLVYRAWKLSCP